MVTPTHCSLLTPYCNFKPFIWTVHLKHVRAKTRVCTSTLKFKCQMLQHMWDVSVERLTFLRRRERVMRGKRREREEEKANLLQWGRGLPLVCKHGSEYAFEGFLEFFVDEWAATVCVFACERLWTPSYVCICE